MAKMQWWRNLKEDGPILWIPIAFVGHLVGRVALCWLALTFLKGPLHLTLGRAEQIGCMIMVWIVSWIPAYAAEYVFKMHPVKVVWADVYLGWLWTVVAGFVYIAIALMGR